MLLSNQNSFLSIFQLFAASSKEGEGFPGGSDGKESAYNTGDQGSIPGSGRSPGKVNDNALHYSCLENPMDRGAWMATVHGVMLWGLPGGSDGKESAYNAGDPGLISG